METTRVFISYSWTTPEHEDWVLSLAHRLVNDGVDVVIDKWDLREGQDKFSFMESMVNASDINKVIIVLDKKYTVKANERNGGVGTETQIISPKVYDNVSQEKFIPIVTEGDEEGKPYIPSYLESRIYIDFIDKDHFEASYEKLLRNILNRPLLAKPALGKMPTYLFEETTVSYKTTTIMRGFDAQVDKYPNRLDSIVRDFLVEFYENLKTFKLDSPSQDQLTFGKQLVENINQYNPLRNDFVNFMTKVAKGGHKPDPDILTRFLERLPSLLRPQDDASSWYDHHFHNFKFIIHELFLYTVAIYLKHDRFDLLEDLLLTRYLVTERYNNNRDPESYQMFGYRVGTLDPYYKQMNGRDFYSCQADFLVKRIPDGFEKTAFINGDLLCYYVGVFQNVDWFPLTYVYKPEDTAHFPFLNRLYSQRHFEKVKGLLAVSTVEELRVKLVEIAKTDEGTRYHSAWSRDSVPKVANLINSEKVGRSK